jgi:uncharacterized protein YbaR (Trm112 family)
LWHIPSGSDPGDFAIVDTHMPVDPALLEILVCPECKTPVRLVHDGAGLRCDTCRRVYPIKDDIPVMLVDEATIEA